MARGRREHMHKVNNSLGDQGFEAWISTINQVCGRFSADAQPGGFMGGIRTFDGGGLHASLVEANSCTRLYRTQADVQYGDGDKLFAVLQLRGQCGVEQMGQSTLLLPGDVMLLDAAHPCSMGFSGLSRQVSLIVPRQAIERNLRAACMRRVPRVPAASTIAGLLGRLMLGVLRQPRDGLSLQEGEAMLDAMVSLLRPAIQAAGERPPNQERLLRRALDFIDCHIESQDLGPEAIARSAGVSVRSLYRLFSAQGMAVAQYIRNRRLDFCAEALRRPGCGEKLSALSYAWGFSDSSHFSAAFKDRFGVSPGEYRRRQLRHAQADGGGQPQHFCLDGQAA